MDTDSSTPAVNALRPRGNAACRLLARNVTAATYQLVRGIVDAHSGEVIRKLMAERQRLLAELARHVNVSGSGLGLWIAKAFVTSNGGEVEAFSEGAGRGTIVSIRLPATEPPKPNLMVGDDDG